MATCSLEVCQFRKYSSVCYKYGIFKTFCLTVFTNKKRKFLDISSVNLESFFMSWKNRTSKKLLSLVNDGTYYIRMLNIQKKK